MKILASFGALVLCTLWAAVATFHPVVIQGTAGIGFLITLTYIWYVREN